MKNKSGFYVFCGLIVLLAVVCVWTAVSSDTLESVEIPQNADLSVDIPEAVPPARVALVDRFTPSPVPQKQPETMDKLLFEQSLEDGATPTQKVGEKGSLNGALETDYPMVYADSKYERIEKSPLLVFTDDMIWSDGAEGFRAKKDALLDQAKHIQEASIALSVSPRVEMGKTTGYRLVEIPENTLFSKMGMVSGDIIVSINGRMPDMEPMALMFVNMAAGKKGTSTIVVDHRGKERTIHLSAAE